MRFLKILSVLSLLQFYLVPVLQAQPKTKHNLQSDHLANRWDEAIPLGNGMLGALVWQKNNKLRLSLDRADLWDERKALDLSKFTYKWVQNQVLKKDYAPVQKLGDNPYEDFPYPTKLPAAAMEFNISSLGKVLSNELNIETALNTVKFENGTLFKCYIHASGQVGYFAFENLPSTGNLSATIFPDLIIHNYTGEKTTNEAANSQAGAGLKSLGYAKGILTKTENSIRYHQPANDENYYEVLLQWKVFPDNKLIGCWTISYNKTAVLPILKINKKEPTDWNTHVTWWKKFWERSSVAIPDELLEKQYYLDMYKLGCVARKDAPAITLQAIWTADNGSLPPWKGDFHNDLNTQLSYWPSYVSNHLREGATFTDWLWKNKNENQRYTKEYFEVEGLNVPGVATINGQPMGGWIQYALSPTVSAWLSQHFFMQWKYSMDKQFLKDRAYPYIHDAATFLENITRVENGFRKLPLSSSPEYNDNGINAWFTEWTNYDLALAKYLFKAANEVSIACGKKEEAAHWQKIYNELPDYASNETGLTLAPGVTMNESHRHMSPYMAIYPLGLLNIENDKSTIQKSLTWLEQKGTKAWCGYSFPWMACMYAKAREADSAVKHLRIFASNFCSTNSFHLNGDQKGGQYSGFTYRPFTLEGNFAFAQGIHELLLQCNNGVTEVFPATPRNWMDVSYTNLRTEGAFLVSANKENGVPSSVKISSEKGGKLTLKLPFRTWITSSENKVKLNHLSDNCVELDFKKGGEITIMNGYE